MALRCSIWHLTIRIHKTSYNCNNNKSQTWRTVNIPNKNPLAQQCCMFSKRSWILNNSTIIIGYMHKNNPIALPHGTSMNAHEHEHTRCLLIYFALFLVSVLEIQPIFMKADVVANCRFHSFEIIPCDALFFRFQLFFPFHTFDSICILLVYRIKEINCWMLNTNYYFIFFANTICFSFH